MPAILPAPLHEVRDIAEALGAAVQLTADLPAEAAHGVTPPDAAPAQPQVRDPERFTGHPVRLRLFEGPLDLLLYLIRAHRYDVFDIPVSEVTEQFLQFLRLMDEVDLEYAGDFLVTAATLMQIKARMLLPRQESASEEEMEDAEADPRRELAERLLEYQRMQEAAATLQEMREARSQLFSRPAAPDGKLPLPEGDDEAGADTLLLQQVSTFDLLRALQRVLQRVAQRPVALVRREPFSLPERIRGVLRRLGRAAQTFGALCEDCESRMEVIITFLAVLELVRRGRVQVTQRALFDEIWVAAATPAPGMRDEG